MPTILSDLRVGTVINQQWRIVALVSQQGVMAEIFKVAHTSDGRIAALKILRPEHVSDDIAIQRADLEAIAGARVRHSNLNAVLDVGVFFGRPYLVTPLLEGHNLREWLHERGPLPIQEALLVAIEVAFALSALHREARAVHRDVKPENIFITFDGEVKLLDLGIAKFLQSSLGKLKTASGELAGSIAYMAPEQLEGEASVASDLYSLGLVLYEMIAGRHPELDENGRWPTCETLVQRLHQGDRPPPLRQMVPACPEAVSRLIDKCLAPFAAQRPGSADELGAQLKRELDQWHRAHPSATPTGTFRWAKPAPQLSLPALGAKPQPRPDSTTPSGAAPTVDGSPKVILHLPPTTLPPTDPALRRSAAPSQRTKLLLALIALGIAIVIAAAFGFTRAATRRTPSLPSFKPSEALTGR